MTFEPAGKLEAFFIDIRRKTEEFKPGWLKQIRKEHGYESIGAGVGDEKKF